MTDQPSSTWETSASPRRPAPAPAGRGRRGMGRPGGSARSEALDRAGDPVEHAVHHRAGQHDPERRGPDDHPRVPHAGVVAAVGDLRLLAGVRVAPDQLRSARRHRRSPQDVLHRRVAVRGRLADRVAVAVGRAAVHRRVADRRRRRRDDAAGHAVDHLGDVPGAGARRGVRGVGLGRGRRGRARSVDRRHPHHRLLVAVGVPRQRRDRAARRSSPASSTCTSRRTSARRASTRPASSRSRSACSRSCSASSKPAATDGGSRSATSRSAVGSGRCDSVSIVPGVAGDRGGRARRSSCGSRSRRVAAGQAGGVRLHRPRAPRLPVRAHQHDRARDGRVRRVLRAADLPAGRPAPLGDPERHVAAARGHHGVRRRRHRRPAQPAIRTEVRDHRRARRSRRSASGSTSPRSRRRRRSGRCCPR